MQTMDEWGRKGAGGIWLDSGKGTAINVVALEGCNMAMACHCPPANEVELGLIPNHALRVYLLRFMLRAAPTARAFDRRNAEVHNPLANPIIPLHTCVRHCYHVVPMVTECWRD